MTHHRRGLRRLLKDDELLETIEADWKSAGLSQPRLAMLTYAVKLTRHPTDMAQTDVQALRDSGFSDLDVLHITEVTSYFAYVNRIADGLGVPLETWIPDN